MSEIYQFPPTTFYRKTGPGVAPMSRTTKAGDSIILLNKSWVDFIFSVNNYNKVACDKIVAPDYGPSKGYNDKGLLKYISLVYPGRNVVAIDRVVLGLDGQKWGVVNGIPMTNLPAPFIYDYYNYPHLIHKLYGVAPDGHFFDLATPIYAPILGSNWYLPMKVLQKIVYPKLVSITAYSLRVRSAPKLGDNTLFTIPNGTRVYVTELYLGSGGIWGKIGTNQWIALRYNGQNLTNWRI